MNNYIVNPGGVIERCDDLMKWAEWYETSHLREFHDGGRTVARTELSDGRFVSTVFLSIDHNFFGNGPPILFETMIFKEGVAEDFQERYRTWAEALARHDQIVAELSGGNLPLAEELP